SSEYVATVAWTHRGPPVAAVLSRTQQTISWRSIDVDSGATHVVRSTSDAAWVDVVPGSGTWDSAGRLLTVEVVDDDYALCADGLRLTPPGLHVRSLVDVGDDDVLVTASA